jgi:hypothetical protein
MSGSEVPVSRPWRHDAVQHRRSDDSRSFSKAPRREKDRKNIARSALARRKALGLVLPTVCGDARSKKFLPLRHKNTKKEG